MLAAQYEAMGDADTADHYRQLAVEALRRVGDRRATAELLLGSDHPTRKMPRISPDSLKEARVLAEEVGWDEGVERASSPDLRVDLG
jgi:hypothetical protein